MTTSGHLFITQGDITQVACDAWLLPTDSLLAVTDTWASGPLSGLVRGGRLDRPRPDGWGSSMLSCQLDNEARPHGVPWMTCIGSTFADVEGYRNAIRQFVEKASAAAHDQTPAFGRAKPLLALPVVGTGSGGAAQFKGKVHADLLPELVTWAATENTDIALVTHDAAALSAAEAARRRLGDSATTFPELDDTLRDLACRLGRFAASGNLVLFLGAGVGVGAGLPLWNELLQDLAVRAEITDAERQQLKHLAAIDQARIVESRVSREAMDNEITVRLSADCYSLSHSLLASLPASEVVTTNYDTLFEMASEAAGRHTAVLPDMSPRRGDRWLLKLHGSVGEQIVLTRDDYLDMMRSRNALTSIVQALLMTRHMLFIGYSLGDDDFHEIAHDVRSVMARKRPAPENDTGSVGTDGSFGTALMAQLNALTAELWRPEIDCFRVGGPSTQHAEAGRLVEIFLDALLSESTPLNAYLLDPSYDDLLTRDERALRESLLDLKRKIGDLSGRAASEVDQYLSQFQA